MTTREHAYQQAGSITVYGETGMTNKKKQPIGSALKNEYIKYHFPVRMVS